LIDRLPYYGVVKVLGFILLVANFRISQFFAGEDSVSFSFVEFKQRGV